MCVRTCSGPHTRAHKPLLLGIHKLPSSVSAPLPLLPQVRAQWELSRGGGCRGRRARAASQQEQTRRGDDGHWALCSGELLPVPWRTGNKQITPVGQTREAVGGRGGEGDQRWQEQSKEGIKGKEWKKTGCPILICDF